jgi:DNA-binding MarR family transcriptional regulator
MPDPRLVDVLTSVQRVLTRDLAERLSDEGASVEQWRVLRTLAEAGEGTSMSELADKVQVPAPSLTRLVDSLVDRAQVYRRPSAHDGRRVDVHLSVTGRQLLTRLEAVAAAHEQGVAHRIGVQELKDALAALDRLTPSTAAGLLG